MSSSPTPTPTLWLLAPRWVGLLALSWIAWSAEQATLLWAALGLSTLSQLWLSLRARQDGALSTRALAAALTLDCGLLTALFVATGGSGSAYTLLYVLPVAIGSMTLPAAGSWGLLALATACYGGLFLWAPADLHAHDPAAMRLHLLGMFGGFALTGLTLQLAFTRLRSERARAEARLAQAREVEARNERLAGLATLAAGAAHELATPLSTILVVSAELKRAARSEAEQEDLELIREEVGRCQEVLGDLSANLGVGEGEAPQRVDLGALIREAVQGRPCEVRVEVEAAQVELPPRLMQQVLRRLADNACRAAPRAEVRAWLDDQQLFIEVTDEGVGMTPEVLARAGEPFFTTRPEQGGRGLGLYFARSVLTQLGGELSLWSEPGRGTRVRLRLPQGAG
ncbi:MAG: HAMP domain-containing histidine kinase [Alphaproteobacteria bacterium]|nr:HAMP domain-containing histidine kinase [Alphaproteobacteria bacterium]MCB9795145.1 HAMP domain-containing histidine kinase [Alphaproteobacteria bacterium]